MIRSVDVFAAAIYVDHVLCTSWFLAVMHLVGVVTTWSKTNSRGLNYLSNVALVSLDIWVHYKMTDLHNVQGFGQKARAAQQQVGPL